MRFGAVHASFPVPATAALGNYTIRIQSGDAQGTGGFEVQEYRKPEFEVIVTPASRFVVQGREAVVTVQARYYFGQPVANGAAALGRQPAAVLLAAPMGRRCRRRRAAATWYGDNQTAQGTLRLDADGKAQIRIPLGVDENGRDFSARIEAQVTDAANREVSGRTIVHATYGTFFLSAEAGNAIHRAGSPVQVSVRALDYLGTPQPNVPVTLVARASAVSIGLLQRSPRSRAIATQNATTDASGRAHRDVHAAQSHRQLPRSAPPRQAASARSATTCSSGCRARATTPTTPAIAISSCSPTRRNYQPGESATLIVRGETVIGPVLVTKEGQHVSWFRVAAAGARRTRSRCRSTKATSATSS